MRVQSKTTTALAEIIDVTRGHLSRILNLPISAFRGDGQEVVGCSRRVVGRYPKA